MKLKKYFIFSLVIILMLIFTTGCTNKKELSSEEFITIMENEEFEVNDSTENFKESSDIKKYIVAVDTKSSFEIEYYEFNDNKKAKELFNKLENKFKNSDISKRTSYQTTSLGNYNYYSLTTDDYYKVVSRINKTVIVTDSNRVNKERIKEVFKKLGY